MLAMLRIVKASPGWKLSTTEGHTRESAHANTMNCITIVTTNVSSHLAAKENRVSFCEANLGALTLFEISKQISLLPAMDIRRRRRRRRP